jgi:hypothetical protein
VTADMVEPGWTRTPISAEQYDSWPEERCAAIEVVDGTAVARPSAPYATTASPASWPTPWTRPRARSGTPTRTSTSASKAAVPFPVTADLGTV